MKELKCKNCGAPLISDFASGQYVCKHCGSVFEMDTLGRLIYVRDPRAQVLCGTIEIPFEARHYMPEEDLSKYTIRELTHKLAEGLAAYMKVDVQEDPCRMATIVRGTVRVIPPDARF